MTSNTKVLSTAVIGFTLACIASRVGAQTTAPDPKLQDPKSTDAKAADTKPAHPASADLSHDPGNYQTFYLNNATHDQDANDIQTALRNSLTRIHMYYLPSQHALSIRGTPEELLTVQKILSDLDRPRKLYRLTYTLTESDSGKRIGIQHFSLVVESGEKAQLKQGSQIPIKTSNQTAQMMDVGLHIEASIDGYTDGVILRTKVDQTSLAGQAGGSPAEAEDPITRSCILENSSVLINGKPLVIGSLDVSGSTRHQEIEVVSELIR